MFEALKAVFGAGILLVFFGALLIYRGLKPWGPTMEKIDNWLRIALIVLGSILLLYGILRLHQGYYFF